MSFCLVYSKQARQSPLATLIFLPQAWIQLDRSSAVLNLKCD